MSIGQEIAVHGRNFEIVSFQHGPRRSPGAKRIWCILTPVGGLWWKDSRNFVVYATFKPDQSWGNCPTSVKVGEAAPLFPLL